MKTFRLFIILAIALIPSVAMAQAISEEDKDWARLAYYQEKNTEVKTKPLAVLFGDSITRNWVCEDASWLEERNFVGRGIGGQTTMQLLVRFRQDVIELNPEYVVILAGINDIARNNGYITVENTFRNLVSMVELAKYNGIKPVMCTLVAADQIGWRKRVGDPRPQIDSLNALIVNYAAANRIPLADYHSVTKDADGGMIQEYRKDAVHPDIDGYKAMEKVLDGVFSKLLSKKKYPFNR